MKNEVVRDGVKVKTKLCPKCREVKPADDFYRSKHNATTGLSSYCKKCTTETTKKWMREHRGHHNAWKRNWREKHKDRDASHKRRHRRLHPDRARARNLLSWAIHTKKIIPQPCRFCGVTKNIEGHHYDYSKPYEVIWLCSDCHKEVHRKLNIIRKQNSKQKRSVPVQSPTGEHSIQVGAGA